MEIDDELASYLQPGPFSVIVVSRDLDLRPESTRGWGQRASEDRQTIDVFVGRGPAHKLLENLAANSAISVAIANVTTYQAIQLKGRCIDIGEADADDLARVASHGEGFVGGLQLVGIGEEAARGVLVSDVVRLRFVPESLFDQTPGPEAGMQR